MKLSLHLFFVLLITFCGFGLQRAEASHAMGADLSYTCIGPNMYEVTATFYRDCDGIAAPATFIVDLFSPSGCGPTSTVTLTQDTLFIGSDIYISGDEVSPLCPTDLANSTCNGGTLPGVEIYVYTGIITLPTNCPDWTIAFSECCRNAAVDNLFNADAFDIYVETTINNMAPFDMPPECNNSVIFTSLPVTYICTNEPFTFNHGAVDPDGDSLVFSMIQPLDDAGVTIAYDAGYSLVDPITTTTGVSFDSVTGEISFTPTMEETCVLTIFVEEYRGGVLIGSTMRDIQIVILNCVSGSSPTLAGSFIMLEGGFAVDSNSIETCPGDTVRFSLNFSDPDIGDTIDFSTNLPIAIPGATATSTGTNPITVDFEWPVPTTDTGFYVFTMTVVDNSCPILGSNTFTFDIDVIAGTFASPDDTYCIGGAPVPLGVIGGSSFVWTPGASLDDSLSNSPLATPTVTTSYIVESDLSALCQNNDTVTIFVVPDFPYTITPADTICQFETVPIGVSTDPTWAPYTYSWTPAAGLVSDSTATTDATPLVTTNYIITMESDTGCVIVDSVPIIIQGSTPQYNAISDIYELCPGDLAQLNMVPKCGPEPAGCGGPLLEGIAGADFLETGSQTPYKAGYDDMRMQILYTADVLREGGFLGGTISELGFFVSEKNSTNMMNNYSISIGCSGLDHMGTTFETGLDLVYGPTSVSTVSGWNTHVLDVPYNWDGESSLIVEICFDNPDFDFSTDDRVYYTNAEYDAVLLDFNLLSEGCLLDEPAVSDNRPNLRIGYCNKIFAGIDILWTPAGGLDDNTIQDPTAGPADDVTYVVVADNNGCFDTDSITLTVDNSLIVDAGADFDLCSYDLVQLMASATGDAPAGGFQYTWIPTIGLSDPTVPDPFAGPDATTTYVVSTTSENGCVGTDTVVANVLPVNANAGPNIAICFGETVDLNASGGVSYSWTPAATLSCDDCPDPVATPTETTSYFVVVDAGNGCFDTVEVTIGVNPIPFVEALSDTTIFAGESAFLEASTAASYIWAPDETLDDPFSPTPTANPFQTTTYVLTITDFNGCISADSVTVTVNDLTEIFVPNAFSPNGDNNNDILYVINRGIADITRFEIYNRWGQLVYSGTDINDGWDGFYNGTEQEIGTYVYQVEAVTLTGKQLQKSGRVTLIR